MNVRRAQRWFWALVVIAILAMSVLYQAVRADPGARAGSFVLVSGVLLAAAILQASRILLALAGPVRVRPWRRAAGRRSRSEGVFPAGG